MTQVDQLERRKQWEVRVREFRASGKTAVAWCAEQHVKQHQLWYWIKQVEKPICPPAPSRWISVQVDEPTDSADDTLLVRLGDAIVEVKPGFNRKLLVDVVSTLSQRGC